MANRDDRTSPADLRRLLDETGRHHDELHARSKKMGEEIRESTRRLREAIARFDARNASR